MCSICRNPKCKYQFGKDKWRLDDGIVIIPLPETNGTLLEAVREYENNLTKTITTALALPPNTLGRRNEKEKKER